MNIKVGHTYIAKNKLIPYDHQYLITVTGKNPKRGIASEVVFGKVHRSKTDHEFINQGTKFAFPLSRYKLKKTK